MVLVVVVVRCRRGRMDGPFATCTARTQQNTCLMVIVVVVVVNATAAAALELQTMMRQVIG